MKISVIGAGNVGSLTAMRIAQEGLGDVVLFDIVKGLAQGKALDLQDSRGILKNNYNITGSDDISATNTSDIIVITAGLARKPGMSREDLLIKNAAILNTICLHIKSTSPASVVIVVTNPLDIMTFLALKVTGFDPQKVLGMGLTLDTSRFANLISQKLNISVSEVEAAVIGSHGASMLPLPRFTNIRGTPLTKKASFEEVSILISKTVNRGAEIVSLLGSGSAFFAPSAAIADMVKAIALNEKRKTWACVFLNGEYGITDLCLGVPCVLSKQGVESIISLDLNQEELAAMLKSTESIRKNLELIKAYLH